MPGGMDPGSHGQDMTPPSCWWKLRSLYKEDTGGLTNTFVWELTQKQITAFRLPVVQANVSGWWEAPCSICILGWRDFLPHSDLGGMRDLRQTQQEETLVLVQALQHCMERSGVPSGVLFNAACDF